MVNWKKFKSLIPNFVQLGPKATYEVVWIDEFKDNRTLGETRFDPCQIVLKNNMTPKLTVVTFLHECLHAYSNEYELALTENLILSAEKGFYYLLKEGNLFKSGRGSNVRSKRRRKKIRRRKA